DLSRGGAGVLADPRQGRLRHVHPGAEVHPAVVCDASGGESPIRLSHAAVWFRAVLYEGNRAALGDDGAHLSRDHSLRDTSGDRRDSLHGLSRHYLLFTAAV